MPFPLATITNMNLQIQNCLLLIFVLTTFASCDKQTESYGGIIRGDSTRPAMALVFTGDEYADGGEYIPDVLEKYQVKGSFFFTGNFYRNPQFANLISTLKAEGHYLGAHSDRHLLYCPWENRDSLLVSRDSFLNDLEDNYAEMSSFGIRKSDARFFMPPYEWYNDSISRWTEEWGLKIVNFTPGTRSNADYTTPDMQKYLNSERIYQSIVHYPDSDPNGFNGFILLIHIGVSPLREDKFYHRLEDMIIFLKESQYQLVRIDDLLS